MFRTLGFVVGLPLAGALVTGRVPDVALLTLAVVAGMPHGALDPEVGRRVFASHGRTWWRPFLAGYVALLAATLALWWALPLAALALFLGLSVAHFGSEDRPAGGTGPRLASTLAHGLVPLVVPALAHGASITAVLAVLVGPKAAGVTALLAGPVAAIWVVATLVSLVVLARQRCSTAGPAHGCALGAALDLLGVAGLFVLASPLVAFSIYFALVHTPRALRHVATAAGRRRWIDLARRSLPATLGALALGLVLFMAGPAFDGANVVRTAFVLLSALTVPHMWLQHLDRLLAARGHAEGARRLA